jgi:hypothetical protein
LRGQDHLKNWRRIVTRYDRLANDGAALALVAAGATPNDSLTEGGLRLAWSFRRGAPEPF